MGCRRFKLSTSWSCDTRYCSIHVETPCGEVTSKVRATTFCNTRVAFDVSWHPLPCFQLGAEGNQL